MNNLFLRHRINKCISIIEHSEASGFTKETLEFLYSSKYRDAMRILESDGCINCTYAWGSRMPVAVISTKQAFSGYRLNRHDIWINRFWFFVSGVAVGVVTAIITQWLL